MTNSIKVNVKNGLQNFLVCRRLDKDNGVKAPKILNRLASICKKEIYKTDRENIKAGFELSPADFRWEYHVDYFDSRLVLKEYDGKSIYFWMYIGNKNKFTANFEGYLPNDMNTLTALVDNFCMAAAKQNNRNK